MSVMDRVREVVADQLEVGAEKVAPESSVAGDLGGDELQLIELVVALEDEFGIRIPDDDITSMRTVGDIARYIEDTGKVEKDEKSGCDSV